MRLLAYILAGLILISVLRLVIIGLCLALTITLLWAVLTRPAETFTALTIGMLVGLLQSHPVVGLVVVGLLAWACRAFQPPPTVDTGQSGVRLLSNEHPKGIDSQ